MDSGFNDAIVDLKAADLNPMLSFQPFELRDDVDAAFFADSLKTNLDTLVLYNPRNGAPRTGTSDKELFPIEQTTIGGWNIIGAAWSVRRTVTWLAAAPSGFTASQNPDAIDPEEQRKFDKAKASRDRHEKMANQFEQVNWNLLLVGLRTIADRPGEAALHCTDSSVRSAMAEFLLRGQFGDLFQQRPLVRRLPSKLLEAVCLDGSARQAALSGIHREVNTKANKKALYGPKLQDAFDPFDDQTFRLESAVSVSTSRQPAFLGVALLNQQVWSTRGKTVQNYADQLSVFFDTLRQAAAEPLRINTGGLQQPGFRSLASAIEGNAISELKAAMDVDFRPRMDLADGEDDDEPVRYGRELERQWFENGAVLFERGDPDSASVTYLVMKDGRPLLRQTVTPLSIEGDISLVVDGTEILVDEEDTDLQLFESLCDNGHLGTRLAIWYESGHVLVNRRLSALKYTDVLFEHGWKWMSYQHGGVAYDVTAEKPTRPNSKNTGTVAALDQIGEQKSIFCYLLKAGPALIGHDEPFWSICDDGSNEIADFIYFAPESRKLWLVHAKGAHVILSSEDKTDAARRQEKLANRGLSVSAFEQVVGQATKNIRFLDPAILADGLEQRKTRHIWVNGARPADVDAERDKIVAALRARPMLSERVLVVAQPHVRQDTWFAARTTAVHDPDNSNSVTKTYKLLSALLADLQITSQKLGVRFYVLGHLAAIPSA